MLLRGATMDSSTLCQRFSSCLNHTRHLTALHALGAAAYGCPLPSVL
jgi:hypothetical protein